MLRNVCDVRLLKIQKRKFNLHTRETTFRVAWDYQYTGYLFYLDTVKDISLYRDRIDTLYIVNISRFSTKRINIYCQYTIANIYWHIEFTFRTFKYWRYYWLSEGNWHSITSILHINSFYRHDIMHALIYQAVVTPNLSNFFENYILYNILFLFLYVTSEI